MSLILSVIVPMYNVEKYIKKNVKSIISNNIKNMEVILINDGSTDNTYEIAYELKQQHPNIIKLYSQKNMGQSSARNFGLCKAKGKYISFIDSDDFISNRMYSTMLEFAEKQNLEIVQCNYLNWYDDNSKKNYPYKFKAKEKQIYTGIEYYEFGPSLSPCDKIYNKDFLNKINFQFENGHYAEDVLALSKTFYYAQRVLFIDELLYFYRIESEDSTRNSKEINKVIKLGKDKIYVAQQLNNFKKEKNWDGAIRKIIFRNLIGSFFNEEIINNKYRKSIFREFKDKKGLKIVLSNLNLRDLLDYINIGINGLLLKRKI